MKLDLATQKLDISCPHCNHKLKETIGRLKRDPHLTCNGCGKVFDVEASGLRKGIKSVEDQLSKFRRDIGKMFR